MINARRPTAHRPASQRTGFAKRCLAARLMGAALAVGLSGAALAGPPGALPDPVEAAADATDGAGGAGGGIDAVGGAAQDVAEATILPGWRQSDGTHIVGLNLQMSPGWKTYWRAPGEAGIPPRFDWTGSENLAATQVLWPTPSVILSNGRQSIGYRDTLILPIVLTPLDPSRPIRLTGQMQAGICGSVCIPMAFDLDASLAPESHHPVASIVTAMRNRPTSGPEAGVRNLRCRLRPSDDGLVVEARLDLARGLSDEVVVFEYDDPTLWIASASVVRKGPSLTAISTFVATEEGPPQVDLSRLRLTILGKDRAIDLNGCPEARSLSSMLRARP